MRRTGLLTSSLLASVALLVASPARACPTREPHKLQSARKGASLAPIHADKKQGKLDDRLIRPHRGYDASAGMEG